MITEEQLAKDREPIPYIPVKQLRRDRPLYVMKQTRPHPIRGYGNSHDEFSVVDIRGYRKGYEPRLDILGQYTPNPHDLFRLGTGRLPPYQPTATGDKLQAEMERLQVHKAWRINPIARGNPMTPEEVTKPRAVVRYKRNYGKERSVNFVEYEYGGERYITGTVVRETDRSLGWYFGKGKEGLREANRIALLSDEEFSKAEDLKKYSWRETLKSISEAKPVPAEVLKDYPDLAKKHSNPEEVPAVPEGLVDVSQLKALDLPNVRLTGSYATGRAKVASDVDILIGLTDEEWTKVTPRTPPPVIERIYSVLPEEKVSPMLYRLSDVKDMWFFKRGRMGVSGAFVPINDAEMVQGLWNSSIGLKEIPSVVENPKPPTPVTPEVTIVKLPNRMTVGELVGIADPNVPLAKLWEEERPYIEKLMRDMEVSGIKCPVTVVVYPDGSKKLWEGHHRLVAAQKLGLKDIPTRFVGPTDAPITEFILERGAIPKAKVTPPAVEEVKLGGGNPIPKELDLARILAIIDSRPKGRIIESKLREEFGDAVIDALRQGRYVVSGSAGYNPPLLVSLKGRELIQGRNPEREVVPAVPEVSKELVADLREGAEYEGRFFFGSYDYHRLAAAKDVPDAPIHKIIATARENYNILREKVGLEAITDWTKRPDETLEQRLREVIEPKPPAVEVPAVPEVRESWQMTKEEFVADPDNPLLLRKSVEFRENLHKSRVFTALKEGKPVPPEVLADYPDLRTREGNPDTGTSIIDLRGDYDEIAHVKDGILYRKGNIVQVWWDKWGKETWTGPSKEQARENFNAMKERWSSSELGNPMNKLISEEAIGMLERLSMTPGEAARSLVADEAERREIMQTVQQRVKREQNKWAPMDPREGPPLPRIFAGLRWPWKR